MAEALSEVHAIGRFNDRLNEGVRYFNEYTTELQLLKFYAWGRNS